jgi:hypothetical protein
MTECPILRHMREVAIMSVSKLKKPIFEALDLEGTKDEARELA